MTRTVLGCFACAALAAVVLVGCGKKESDSAPESASSAVAPTTATAAALPAAPVIAPTPVPTPVVTASATDTASIKNCCSALHAGESSAAPKDKSTFQAAAAACDGIAALVASGKTSRSAALTSIRAALKAGTLPSACH